MYTRASGDGGWATLCNMLLHASEYNIRNGDVMRLLFVLHGHANSWRYWNIALAL
jgi:hypothetical protein